MADEKIFTINDDGSLSGREFTVKRTAPREEIDRVKMALEEALRQIKKLAEEHPYGVGC